MTALPLDARLRDPYGRLATGAGIVWLSAFVVVALTRPGETLEVALLGVVGAVAIAEARLAGWRLPEITVALLFIAAPLVDSWPGRKWQAAAGRLPAPLDGFLNLHSVLLIAALIASGRAMSQRQVPGRLVAAAAALLIAGGVLGALVNLSVASFADAWMAFVVPVGVGYVAARAAKDAAQAWRLVSLAVLAALVPIALGIAAFVLSFGIPTSGSDLVFAKLALFRPHLFQDVTFGNVGHFGDVALLLLPAAALGAVQRSLPLRLRLSSAATTLGLIIVLAIVLSRAAIVIAIAALCGTFVAVARRRLLPPMAVAGAAAAALALLLASPAIRGSFNALVAPQSHVNNPAAPHPTGVGAGHPLGDASTQMRESAISSGIRIARDHLPFGIGSGRYASFDPVHTAPHSLFVQVLAEDGILGAAGFSLLILFVAVEFLRLILRPGTDDLRFSVRVACTMGAGAFLLDGVVAGAPLALAQLNVWPLLLWLQLGLLVGVCRRRV